MELVREANARGDWKAAGCSSEAQWYAQVYGASYQTAKIVTETALALAELPKIDDALGAGEITFDQTAAAVENATPETDAEIARLAPGKAPSQIAREVRKLNPPKLTDDRELYRRRKLSMAWTDDRRELLINGRLPLEHGVAFENAIWDIAKQQRADDKKHGVVLEWQQSAADALVTLATHDGVSSGGGISSNGGGGSGGGDGGVRRTRATTIVHLSADEPPVLEGAGAISTETAEHLTCNSRLVLIKPHGNDLVHSRVGRDASWFQLRALSKRTGGQCQHPGCTATHELEAHHMIPVARGGKTELTNLILLCPRHHKRHHDHGLHTTGRADQPAFRDADGRLITANQPHAPPS